MTLKDAKKILSNNGITWTNYFDLLREDERQRLSSHQNIDVRKAISKLRCYIVYGIK